MARPLLLILAILFCNGALISALPTYWQLRQRLLLNEQRRSLGGQLKMNPIEMKANKVLIAAKTQEIIDGFRTGDSFLPARNFMEVIPQIEKSKVFKILRDLPKGGVLHAHDVAITSLDYKLYNLTYRDNLYMCDANKTLRLKFFKTPDSTCAWQLLKDVRKNPKRADVINERIRRQLTMITKDPKKAYDTVNKAWTKFSSIFSFSYAFITYKPIYVDHLYRGLQEFYDDNVMYVELRSTLPSLYDLDGKTYTPLEIVRIQKEVSERFAKDHPGFIGVRIIYGPSRLISPTKMDDYLKTMVQLKKAFPDFVIGFDLVGQEDKGQPLISFVNQLSTANSQIHFFFHAGETNWNGMITDMNLIDAVLLNTKRIGHGYALTKHPLLWDLAKKLDIAVEICPISNQVLGLVNDMRNHPATSMFATESPVVISNDDPGLWGAQGLTYDFYEAFMGLMSASSDLRSLKQLALNSLVYSSLNEVEKDNALAQWQGKWDAFVAKLAAKEQNENGLQS